MCDERDWYYGVDQAEVKNQSLGGIDLDDLDAKSERQHDSLQTQGEEGGGSGQKRKRPKKSF